MLQVVGIRNKYVFAPCFTLWVVPTCIDYYVCFMDAAWTPALLRYGVLRLFSPCPKKNVLVMACLTRGDCKRENKQKAS